MKFDGGWADIRDIALFSLLVCTVAMNIFYIGYYREIGHSFIGFMNMLDVFYNLTGMFGFVLFAIFVASTASVFSLSRSVVLVLLVFFIVVSVVAVLLFAISKFYKIILLEDAAVLLMFGVMIAVNIYFASDHWPIKRVMDVAFCFPVIFMTVLFFVRLGEFSAKWDKILAVDRYNIVTQNSKISTVAIIRSSQSGVLYISNGRTHFLNLSQVISIERLAPRGFGGWPDQIDTPSD